MLTDTVWNILKENAKLNKMSVSEYVEQVSRGLKAPPRPTSTG
jgi:pyocin large subunit-like protein